MRFQRNVKVAYNNATIPYMDFDFAKFSPFHAARDLCAAKNAVSGSTIFPEIIIN